MCWLVLCSSRFLTFPTFITKVALCLWSVYVCQYVHTQLSFQIIAVRFTSYSGTYITPFNFYCLIVKAPLAFFYSFVCLSHSSWYLLCSGHHINLERRRNCRTSYCCTCSCHHLCCSLAFLSQVYIHIICMRVYPNISGLATCSKNWMVQLSATSCSSVAILWVSLVTFAAITLCVATQWAFVVVVVYFIIDSVWDLMDTPLYSWSCHRVCKFLYQVTLAWRWRQHRYLKCRYPAATLRGITTIETSNLQGVCVSLEWVVWKELSLWRAQ
jgi:hypothetical protein